MRRIRLQSLGPALIGCRAPAFCSHIICPKQRSAQDTYQFYPKINCCRCHQNNQCDIIMTTLIRPQQDRNAIERIRLNCDNSFYENGLH